jgi:hypothetical protein
MWHDNLSYLDQITLRELEEALDYHTREKIKTDRYTEFSWSVTRHQTFIRCKRQYYLSYYGSRRVREANNKAVSAIWWLKQVTSLESWIGTVIHQVARQAIQSLLQRQPFSPEELARQATTIFREGVQASQRGMKHEDRWVILFHHVYPGDPPSLDRNVAEQAVVDLTHTLLESEAYALIKSMPLQAIREVDEAFQEFEMRDVPLLGRVRVFAIPDVLLYHNGRVHIIDWKTGDTEIAGIRDQAGVYRLYAHHQYKLPEEAIQVVIADLKQEGQSVEPPGGTPSLDEARALIRTSIQAMVEQMDDIEYNTATIKNFPMTDERTICRWCGFKRACWRS